MLTLFGNLDSGNVHKVQMILTRRGLPFRRVDVRQDRGEPRDPRFLALNRMGKVPAVRLDSGDMLSDSGALLFYFAQGTTLWPNDARHQAEVLRWMFFEQYNHEPTLAVIRYLKRFATVPGQYATRIAELLPKAEFALGVLEQRLGQADWVAGIGATIADYALYPYTRMAGEIGIDIARWPAVERWLARVEALPRFVPLYADAAIDVIGFQDYFSGAP